MGPVAEIASATGPIAILLYIRINPAGLRRNLQNKVFP